MWRLTISCVGISFAYSLPKYKHTKCQIRFQSKSVKKSWNWKRKKNCYYINFGFYAQTWKKQIQNRNYHTLTLTLMALSIEFENEIFSYFLLPNFSKIHIDGCLILGLRGMKQYNLDTLLLFSIQNSTKYIYEANKWTNERKEIIWRGKWADSSAFRISRLKVNHRKLVKFPISTK